MRNHIHILYIIAVLTVSLAAATSCRHKDIECPSGFRRIHILFEWDKSRDAQVEGMTLFFYPLDGQNGIWRFEIAGRDGGDVELPVGTYRMIACNNDLPGITLEDTESESTVQASASRTVEDGVFASTGMLYGAVISSLDVTPCGVRYITEDSAVKECGKGLVRCYPDSLATNFTVRILDVAGIENISSAAIRLDGMRKSIFLESGATSYTPVALAIPSDIDRADASISGAGCAFSPPAAAPDAYSLSLKVIRSNGTCGIKHIDLTERNTNIITRHNVLITIAGIKIPDDGSSSDDVGGIQAGVDGWEVVEIDLSSTK